MRNATNEEDRPFPGWRLWNEGLTGGDDGVNIWVDANVGEWGAGMDVVAEDGTKRGW